MNLKPNTGNVCNKFKTGNLVLELPQITNYSILGTYIVNIIKGINIISDYEIESCKNERLEVINQLSKFVIAMDCYEELNHLDRLIEYNKLELSKDEETTNLLEQIDFLQESNRCYINEITEIKKHIK